MLVVIYWSSKDVHVVTVTDFGVSFPANTLNPIDILLCNNFWLIYRSTVTISTSQYWFKFKFELYNKTHSHSDLLLDQLIVYVLINNLRLSFESFPPGDRLRQIEKDNIVYLSKLEDHE